MRSTEEINKDEPNKLKIIIIEYGTASLFKDIFLNHKVLGILFIVKAGQPTKINPPVKNNSKSIS